jgi:hypothetical protein
VFASTWDNVYRAVEWVVEYGIGGGQLRSHLMAVSGSVGAS